MLNIKYILQKDVFYRPELIGAAIFHETAVAPRPPGAGLDEGA